MDQQLEKRLKEMTKEDFRDILKKLSIEVKASDTDSLNQEQRYELYKNELEKKFKETGIQISTVEDLRKLKEAGSLNEFKSEIVKHEQEIISGVGTNRQINTFSNTTGEKKSWIKEQFEKVMNKEERKEHTGANILRVAGGIGIIAVGIRGIKKLFGIGKKKEKKEGEEKSFWDTGFGKLLKRIGIGVGGFLGIRALMKLLGKNKDSNDAITTTQHPIHTSVEMREKIPETLKPKYNEVGTHIKGMYKNIFQGEMRGTDTPDELVVAKDFSTGQEKTLPSGIFVGVMDNIYDNVGTMLSTKSKYSEGLNGKIDEFIDSIKEKIIGGAKEVGKFFAPFTGLFGLTQNMFDAQGNATNEFQQWILDDRMERKEQISFILRQYARIRLFLHQKELLLRRKLTAKKIGVQDITDPQVEEYLENDTFQEEITKDIEKIYRNKKIVDATGDDITQVLKEYNIYDDQYDPSAKEKIENINEEQQHEVTDPMNTILEDMENVPDTEPIPSSKIQEVQTISKQFQEAIKDESWEDNWRDTFMGRAPIDVWLNTEHQDRKAFMQAIGYDKIIAQFLQKNNEILSKITSGKGTKKDLLELKEVMESFYHLQKEVALGAQMENVIDSERGVGEKILLTIQGFGIVEIAIIGGVLYVYAKFKTIRRIMNWTVLVPRTAVKESARRGMRNLHIMDNVKITRYLRRFAFRNETTFMNYFRKGKINIKQAEMILRRASHKKYGRTCNNIVDLITREFFGGNMPSELFMINGTRRVMNIKDVQRFFDKSYALKKFMMQADDKVTLMKHLFEYEDVMNSVSGNKKILMEEILRLAKFEHITDIPKVAQAIKTIDIKLLEGLNNKQITKLARMIGKDVEILKNTTKLTEKINEIKKAISTVEHLTDIQKTTKQMILNQIKIFQEQLKTARGAEKHAINAMIREYDNIAKNISQFADDEVKILKQFIEGPLDMRYISKILTVENPVLLIKNITKAKNILEFELALKQAKSASIDEMIKVLKNTGKFNDFFKQTMKHIGLYKEALNICRSSNKLLSTLKIISKIPV